LYLLDTSAFRNLKGEELQARTYYLSASSVWKVLAHLHAGDFARQKGQLMKASHTKVLDEPRALVEIPLLQNATHSF
jgi:hypothetical protein